MGDDVHPFYWADVFFGIKIELNSVITASKLMQSKHSLNILEYIYKLSLKQDRVN